MRTEVEDAVERLTEAMNDAIADHEDDVSRAWEAGERPDLWDAPDVTVSIPDLRALLAALRAQAERVRALEGERDYAWGEMKNAQAYWRAETAHAEQAEARAEAAERRAGELEGALRKVDQTLQVLAAEYVPAIPDAWKIIDKALKQGGGQ